jgi:DNA-binding HxlR family transcriptional regulator
VVTPTYPRECSIARSLDLLGPRWTPLVLRELMFGAARFEGIAAATGAPRDMLTKRLRALEGAGLVRRRPYTQRPPRYEYELTDLGRDAGEVLLTLMSYGDRHLSPDPPVTWRHWAPGAPDGDPDADHDLEPVLVCHRCGHPATAGLHDPRGPGAPAPDAPDGNASPIRTVPGVDPGVDPE